MNRTAFAEEPGTTIVSIGGIPGKAYDRTAGSSGPRCAALYEAGDYAEAADRGREMLEANPYAGLFFNVACCESLAGRTTDALEHLRRAIELSEQFRDYAQKDSDLDAIREEPAFRELVGD